MNILEAIEMLSAVVYGGKLITDDNQRTASKLGLEALRYIQRSRNYPNYPPNICLEGETLPHLQLNI